MFNLYGYFTNTQRKTNQEVPEGWKWKGAITAENMILKKEFRATKTECSIEMEGWQHKDNNWNGCRIENHVVIFLIQPDKNSA